MLKEFKAFAMRGNVLDLAVGVIIGGAFGKIVASLVNDIIMPLVGVLLGGINFSEQVFLVGAAEVRWGLFIQTIIDFLIIAFIIFLIIRGANRLRQEPPPPEPTTKECPHCFSVINIKATRCPECTSELSK